MKITLPLITCASVLCLTLAGCGGSNSNNNRSSSSAPDSLSSSSIVSSESVVNSSAESSESSSSDDDQSSSAESSLARSSDDDQSSSAESSAVSSATSSQGGAVVSSVSSSLVSSTPAISSLSSVSSSSVSSMSSSEVSSAESSSEASSSESSSVASDLWTLVWEDNFDGEPNIGSSSVDLNPGGIDMNRWSHEVNCWGGGNNEAQCYTAEPENSYVSGGILHIVAAYKGPDGVSGPALNQEDPGYPGATISKDYSSARLRTRNQGDWTYGRMEISAKMPMDGAGVWPAIWMLPTDTVYGGWPNSGEIDIFEAFQPGVAGADPTGAENTIHGTLHYGITWPWNNYSGASYEPAENIWDEFRVYAVEWEEGEIRWYVDGVLFARNSGNWFTYYWDGQERGYQVGTGAAPFDQAFHMILNVALGNGEYVPSPTFTDQRIMEVEYVRVYECSVDPATGKGCETPSADPGVPETNIGGHGAPAGAKDVLWLYRDGLQTLNFTVGGAAVDSTLDLGVYECIGDPWCIPEGNVTSQEVAISDGPDGGAATVWDVQLGGISNVFIMSDDGLNFGGNNYTGRAQIIGELKFDLRVIDIDPGTRLRIKLDSGYPNLSFHEIDIPETGEWAPVAVRFYTLTPNDNEAWAPSVDFTNVVNPFVIEPVGGNAHVQLNNIRIDCLDNCNIRPVVPPVDLVDDFDIYVNGSVDPLWDFGTGTWDNDSGSVTLSDVYDADHGHNVWQVDFSGAQNGLAFIQSNVGRDVSAFAANGQLVFDIKVLSYGTNTNGLVVKIESGPSTGTGDLIINPPVGEWTTFALNIADMIAHAGTSAAFNMSTVNSPFVFLPAWDDQGGVSVQLDNIRWELP